MKHSAVKILFFSFVVFCYVIEMLCHLEMLPIFGYLFSCFSCISQNLLLRSNYVKVKYLSSTVEVFGHESGLCIEDEILNTAED